MLQIRLKRGAPGDKPTTTKPAGYLLIPRVKRTAGVGYDPGIAKNQQSKNMHATSVKGIPQKRHSEKAEKFEGAYVKDPIVGEHKWIMSFDLNSLYPHLMMQYNISPETLKSLDTVKGMKVDKLLNKEVDTAAAKMKKMNVDNNDV